MDFHPQAANAFLAQSNGGGQHKVGAIRFQQVRRAHIGPKSFGDEGNDVHQRFRRLAAIRRKVSNLF
jgi:hypothetical protein